MSRLNLKDGSSSKTLVMAELIFSSSPRVLGSTAKLIAGSGKSTCFTVAFTFESPRVSPVPVFLSFSTPPISPLRSSETA